MNVGRQQAERDATRREPDQADALEHARIARARECGSRGWPRKITPKNFTIT